MEITLDRQVVSQRCVRCETDFTVVRGSVYEDGRGIGLYLIALHGHAGHERSAHLAVALVDRSGERPQPVAAALDVIAMPEQPEFKLVEWGSSPWRDEDYLGRMLSPEQVLVGPHRPMFFHVAEHVVRDLPEVRAFLADPAAGGS